MTRTASVIVLAGILAGIPTADLAARTAGIRVAATPLEADTLEVATFAGGCFWCMEEAFDAVAGVEVTISGYTGGTVANPGYDQVSSGRTGHLEAVNVFFDPQAVSYAELLDAFWRNVDPTDDGGQFCDRGSQYVSAIFVRNERQRALAEASKRALESDRRIVTPILPATTFWPAEEYHQDYYTKNPVRYRFYKFNCGRKARLEKVWGEIGG
ncbi:MAG TPA: peptide-methionine (S)-S-oxide reductase MsrA [Gemmatimonadota bacterium]|nr:peptide-methionine (S)-S-oxide reductase MsrA [Gemmatimonadota bacterium]